MVQQPGKKRPHVDTLQTLILVKRLVNDRQRIDAVPRSGDSFLCLRIFQLPALEVQKACHDLKVVLHAMVDLLHGGVARRDRLLQVAVPVIDVLGHNFHGARQTADL